MWAAVIVNTSKKEALKFLPELIGKLDELEIVPVMFEIVRKFYYSEKVRYVSNSECLITESCDVVITVGGDGTIIHMASHCAEADKPLLGINFGRVGFVATMEPDEISELSKLKDGNYFCEERMMLRVSVIGNSFSEEFYAINDAVISRGSLSRMMDLSVYANSQHICDYRADGLIFSTPTGSTAYSLSAGGPVISPDMSCILLTPICPHSLFSRSVLFRDRDIIKVNACGTNGFDTEAFLTIDGQKHVHLDDNTEVTIEKCDKSLRLISMKPQNFYTVLNNKLNERG